MSEEEDKLQLLFEHLIDLSVESVYIEDDTFCITFNDGTLIELFSEDDLSIYFEVPKEKPSLH